MRQTSYGSGSSGPRKPSKFNPQAPVFTPRGQNQVLQPQQNSYYQQQQNPNNTQYPYQPQYQTGYDPYGANTPQFQTVTPYSYDPHSTPYTYPSHPSHSSYTQPYTPTHSEVPQTNTSSQRVPATITSQRTIPATSLRPSTDDAPVASPVVAVSRTRPSRLSNVRNRLSQDDSSLGLSSLPDPHSTPKKSGGLGRLRRALSFNAAQTLQEEESEPQTPRTPVDDSTPKKKSRAASLFSSRFNSSTDNLSLSSTVSSASVMIRKLGSMGKLARRNSMAGIKSVFTKDKDRRGESDGEIVPEPARQEPVERERGSDSMVGLSPAAKLARAHMLKSTAEPVVTPPTWEKNTATRQATSPRAGSSVVREDGTRGVLIEDESDDETIEARPSARLDGWDDDEDWNVDQDTTIRMGKAEMVAEANEEVDSWAVDIGSSAERTLTADVKGILKNAGTYRQETYASSVRNQSNSYTGPGAHEEPGPLARIPSPKPDHIDGLHRHGPHHTSTPHTTTFRSESPVSAIYAHPIHNSSAPTLSLISSYPGPIQRAQTAPARNKTISFANNLSIFDTFPPSMYDRRSEQNATWSRLTPALAGQIKEELNSFKMEMDVHAESRTNTQFFV